MEISIKTTELGGVIIELGGAEAANVLDQAERAGKVPALENQVQNLKDELAAAQRDRATYQQVAVTAEAKLKTAEGKAHAFNLDRKQENERASRLAHELKDAREYISKLEQELKDERNRRNENREWAEEHLERRTRERDDREKARAELERQLNSVIEALQDSEDPHSARVSRALALLDK